MAGATAGPMVASPQPAASPTVRVPAREPKPQPLGNQALLRKLQAKLTIGAVDDPLEHEADAAAEQVMRAPDPEEPEVTAAPPHITRKCEACEAEEKVQAKCDTCEGEATLQAKREDDHDSSEEAPVAVDQALKQPGRPLDDATRGFFEPRFGADFSAVRVHTGLAADKSAKSVGAMAYAVGHDMVFADGRFSPDTQGGRKLLAHELAHVVQQGGGAKSAVRRDVNPPDPAGAQPADADGAALSDAAVSGQEDKTQTGILRRQPATNTSPPDDPGATPEPTRPEEIAASRSSDGLATGSLSPPSFSLYNFAIDGADLKPLHKQLIAELGALIKSAGAGAWLTIEATGNADSSGPPEVNTPLSEKRAENVQAALQTAAGASVGVQWHGEDNPAVSNDTAEGRTRNRRVDIDFTVAPAPGGKDPDPTKPDPDPTKPDPDPTKPDPDPTKPDPDPTKPDPTKKDPTKKDDDNNGSDWFCQRHPIICLIIGGGIAFGIACYLRLIPCVPIPPIVPIPTDPTVDPTDPKQKQSPKEKACIVDSDLPSGLLEVDPAQAELLFSKRFEMKLDFKEDGPAGAATGDAVCRAYCGEYRQNVKGFFQIVRAGGRVEDRKHHLSTTTLLDPKTFKEDGEVGKGSYGHRFADALRTIERPNIDDYDKFLPTRRDGPQYRGLDQPGIPAVRPFDSLLGPGDTFNMNLDFEGGPVDTCALGGSVAAIPTRLGSWNNWSVKGTYTKPGGAPSGGEPGGGGPGPAPTTPASETTPKPFTGPLGGPMTTHLIYAGGLGANPSLGPGTVRVKFTTNGVRHFSTVPVEVIEVRPDGVTIKIAGAVPMNIAPDGEPAIVFIPGRTVPLPRAALARWP